MSLRRYHIMSFNQRASSPPDAFIKYYHSEAKYAPVKACIENNAVSALTNMGGVSGKTVALLCNDVKFMNLLCTILVDGEHSPPSPIGTMAEALEEDMTCPNLEEALNSEGHVKTVEEPPATRIVSPNTAPTLSKRKANVNEDSMHLPPASVFLGGDLFLANIHDPNRLTVKKKARQDDTGITAPVTRPQNISLHKKKAIPSTSTSPFKNDPVDETFLDTLHDVNLDTGRINPAHMIMRNHVLEVRRSVSGRVFFQCKYCKHLPHHLRSNQSTISPQSIDKLYRAYVRFSMYHITHCEYIPDWIKEYRPKSSKIANSMGGKENWQKNAKKRGLRDDVQGKSIIYRPEDTHEVEVEN